MNVNFKNKRAKDKVNESLQKLLTSYNVKQHEDI